MSTQKVLGQLFNKLDGTTKWQLDFFIELFDLIYSIQGRINFQNMCRYSQWNESTFRRNFQKPFDWFRFNLELIKLAGVKLDKEVIAAFDCSFISKSGKKTYGLDRFWSGCLGKATRGLEIGLVSLIDVSTRKAWALHVRQTPADLSTKQEDILKTRIDFYLEQIKCCAEQLKSVTYMVGDGFYAKTKVFQTMITLDKYFITKLRPDANLRYLYQGEHPKRKGKKSRYAGKIDFDDITLWQYCGNLQEHIEVYSVVANSPKFKQDLKIVMLYNVQSNTHVLLSCTDLNLEAFKIIDYYRLRFQLEFLFRDAKQFMGLTHCQARSQEKLDFHFNFSLAAINMANYQIQENPNIISINTFKRIAYNTRFTEVLFMQLSLFPKFDINSQPVQNAINLGRMWYPINSKAA